MIKVKDLKFKFGENFAENISFDVDFGEIYFIIFKEDPLRRHFFEIMRGFCSQFDGDIFIDGKSIFDSHSHLDAVFINRLEEVHEFDTDATMEQFIDYCCASGKIDKLAVFEHLIRLHINEDRLKKRIKDERPDIFRMVYLSVLLGMNTQNIVFNNFINVDDKVLQIEFNKTLIRKRNEGKSILYLTGDLFYAFHVADKISFVKNGYLAPTSPIVAADFKEMDVMKLYKQYMS